MTSDSEPPPPPDWASGDAPYTNERYQALLEDWKAARQGERADATAEALSVREVEAAHAAALDERRLETQKDEAGLVAALHASYITVAQTTIDRSLTRTGVLTAAITTLIGLDTTLLALVYAAKPGDGKPLSAAALVSPFFLGLALVGTVVFTSVARTSSSSDLTLRAGITSNFSEERLAGLIRWCAAIASRRLWALYAAIASLILGVASLPLPFISTDSFLIGYPLIGVVIVVAIGLWGWQAERTTRRAASAASPSRQM